jgi:hypothetical protein
MSSHLQYPSSSHYYNYSNPHTNSIVHFHYHTFHPHTQYGFYLNPIDSLIGDTDTNIQTNIHPNSSATNIIQANIDAIVQGAILKAINITEG